MNLDRPFTRREFLAKTALASAAIAMTGPSAMLGQSGETNRYKIIGFSKPFQSLSFDETADLVAEVGWDGIECPVRPRGQIEPERAADELPRLAEALRKRGREITIVTSGIRGADEPHAETVIRAMVGLGIKRYRLGFWRYDMNRDIATQVREQRARLRDLVEFNRELGIQGSIQNHSGSNYVGAPVWDLYEIMRDLDPKHTGICFDIGHATIEGGNAWQLHARLMEPYFSAVFLKDFLWQKEDRGWRSRWQPLGEGMVDPRFFTWLKQTEFKGPISQHHEYVSGSRSEMVAAFKKDLSALRGWLSGA
jgi:sugar phosphate isomerase/epimerase